MFQVDQLRSGYFGNLSKVGSVVGYLSVIVQCQFLLHICILVWVMFRFLPGQILYFMGISTVVFRVSNSGGVFPLNVSGNARFFPAVQTICEFGNFIRIN